MEKVNNNVTEIVEEVTEGVSKHTAQETSQAAEKVNGNITEAVEEIAEDKEEVIEKVNNNAAEVVEEVTEDKKKASLYDQLQALRKAERESRSPDKLKADYQQRLSENLSLEQRAVNLLNNDEYHFSINHTRVKQLEENFSKEQIAALNDETLVGILRKFDEEPMDIKIMNEIKKFTPEQLIELQSYEDGGYLIYDALSYSGSPNFMYGYRKQFGQALIYMKDRAGFPEDEIKTFRKSLDEIWPCDMQELMKEWEERYGTNFS